MRRFGRSIRKEIHYKQRMGAYGLFLAGDQLLLTGQLSEGGIEWQFPGGGVEKGEAIRPALIREAYEETGWKVSVEARLGVYQRYTYMPDYDLWARKVCQIYFGRAIRQLGPALEHDHMPLFVPIDNALDILDISAERHFLERYLQKRRAARKRP